MKGIERLSMKRPVLAPFFENSRSVIFPTPLDKDDSPSQGSGRIDLKTEKPVWRKRTRTWRPPKKMQATNFTEENGNVSGSWLARSMSMLGEKLEPTPDPVVTCWYEKWLTGRGNAGTLPKKSQSEEDTLLQGVDLQSEVERVVKVNEPRKPFQRQRLTPTMEAYINKTLEDVAKPSVPWVSPKKSQPVDVNRNQVLLKRKVEDVVRRFDRKIVDF